jgi:hypothetical protein
MATATAQRSRTRSISSATAAPQEAPAVGDDGYPVRMWEVNGELVAFSLRPFEPHERKRYWNPQGEGAPMWWRSQERNEWGLQPIIQREIWVAGDFSPRNAWEEYMTIEWLKTVPGGDAGHTWVGYDHPKNQGLPPEAPRHHWICAECNWACGVLACLEQHLLSKPHSGIKSD